MAFSKRFLYVFALILLYMGNVSCFAIQPEGGKEEAIRWWMLDYPAREKAYYKMVDTTEARLENDTAFIQLKRAYEIFQQYAVKTKVPSLLYPEDSGRTDEILTVKRTKIADSIKALSYPYFERLHQRSELVCKDRVLQNDTLKELSKILLAWYTKTGRNEYFVERMNVAYTTQPCVQKPRRPQAPGTMRLVLDSIGDYESNCEARDYIYADTLCVDTRGTKYKRIFLTYDDEEELDIFSGCNRLKGVMEFEYDRYDMNGFMPIETSLNQYDMCFDYGASSFDHVNLYLDKGEAYLPSGCDIFKFKKVDGVWKYMGMFVGLCFH